jgi:NADH-quinone oxidoreductase E subunit
MTFAFTHENLTKIAEILKKYPDDRKASAVLPLLDLAQRQNDGWLKPSAIAEVANLLGMAEMRVYEVVSFYTMFNLKPVGKYHVQVCGTIPCALRGAEEIMEVCKDHLNISLGQTTADGTFTLSEVECLGACVNAPMLQINDDFFEDLTPESTKKLLEDLKSGKVPKCGSQAGRQCSKAASC